MNPAHGRDLEGQPILTQYLYTSHCLLQKCMHTHAFIEASISRSCFLLSSPHSFLLYLTLSHSFYVPSLWLSFFFLSFFLTLILSLRPIFCLIAPISSTSHCPNSESVHFNLMVSLVGMMDSLSGFAAGFAHQPVHLDRHVKYEMVWFLPLPKRAIFTNLKGSIACLWIYAFKNLCMELWRCLNCAVHSRPCPANWVCPHSSPPSGYRCSGAVPCRYPPTPSLHWHCSCLHQVMLLFGICLYCTVFVKRKPICPMTCLSLRRGSISIILSAAALRRFR